MRIFFLFFLVICSACATTSDRVLDVSRGMDAATVREKMGNPQDRTFRGKQEHWVYKGEDGKGKLIVFENGKVVELLNAEAAEKVMHQVGNSDVNTQGRRVYHCAGNNEFGRFSDGGGCNMYGCWAPGGYCNQWGCTAQGVCTSKNCPNKIPSFQCED